MKVAIYPGSFDPWHEGHSHVLNEALLVFDKVIILRAHNLEKKLIYSTDKLKLDVFSIFSEDKVEVTSCQGLLVDFIFKYNKDYHHGNMISAIIKGLRNTTDFEYEKIQQYHNEDLGISIPTYYIITNRNLTHISSSAIRAIDKCKKVY